MYNAKRKNEFIKVACEENPRMSAILSLRFRRTEILEKQLGRDLCDWTVAEIIDYYQSQFFKSLESLMVIHSEFNRYAKWCLMNDLIEDHQNHFDELDRKILNSECINHAYLDNGIRTREEVLEIVNGQMLRNVSERFLVLALFEGIGGKGYSDFATLTMNDFEGNTVKLRNRTISVSQDLVQLAQKSSETFEYYSYGNSRRTWNYNSSDKRVYKLKEGNQINPSPVTYRHIVGLQLNRLAKEFDTVALSSSMLFESGRIHMIKEYMKEENIDVVTAITKHQDEISLKYGKIHAIQRYADKWKQFFTKD